MELNNSSLKTLENFFEFGILYEYSFKDKIPYLNKYNPTILWIISTQISNPRPFLSFGSNGVLENF